MTSQEAIKWVQARLGYGRYTPSDIAPFIKDECYEAGILAIDAIETVDRINNWIGTDEAIIIAELVHRYGIDAVKSACKKQIPQKPKEVLIDEKGYINWVCQCGAIHTSIQKVNGCSKCLQVIDWSDNNG